jgi:hypothetical protein
MSAITQFRPGRSLLQRLGSTTRGIYTAIIAPDQSNRPQPRIKTTGQLVPNESHRWLRAAPQIDTLAFQASSTADKKGQQSMLIWAAQQVEANSPAAALAIMDFLAKQTSEIQGLAIAERTRLLSTVYPTDAARYSARTGRHFIRDIDGRQTNELAYLELSFVALIHGTAWSVGIDQRQMARQLSDLATEFVARGDQKRAATAHFILADLYLQRRELEIGTRELAAGIVLASAAYNNTELFELARQTFGEGIVDMTYRDAPTDTRDHVLELARS